MNKHNFVSKISLLAFVTFNNYILYNAIILKSFYQIYKQSFYFAFVIGIGIAFLLSILIRNRRRDQIIDKIHHNNWIKFSLAIYFFFSAFIISSLSCAILSKTVFTNEQVLYFFIPLILIGVFISRLKSAGIINSFFLPICAIVPFIIFSFFISHNVADYNQLFPLYFTTKNWYFFFLIIYVVMDNFVFFLVQPSSKFQISSKFIFLANLIMLLFMTVQGISFISLIGPDYLLDYEYVGFVVHNIHSTFQYLGNQEYIYIFVIAICGIMKISFNTHMLKEIFKVKKKSRFSIVVCIIFIGLSIPYFKYYHIMARVLPYAIFGLLLSLLPYYIYLLFYKETVIKKSSIK